MVSAEITAHMQRDHDSVELTPGHRSITLRWVLRVNDDGTQEIAALYASHFRGHGYRATLNRVRRQLDNGSGFVAETSEPMSAVVVLDETTAARFSLNNLQAFLRRAVAVMRDPANAERFGPKFDAGVPAT